MWIKFSSTHLLILTLNRHHWNMCTVEHSVAVVAINQWHIARGLNKTEHSVVTIYRDSMESSHRKRVRVSIVRRCLAAVRAYLLVTSARTACGVRAPLRLNWLNKGGNARRTDARTPPLPLRPPLSCGPPLVTLTREHYGLNRRSTDLRYNNAEMPTHYGRAHACIRPTALFQYQFITVANQTKCTFNYNSHYILCSCDL